MERLPCRFHIIQQRNRCFPHGIARTSQRRLCTDLGFGTKNSFCFAAFCFASTKSGIEANGPLPLSNSLCSTQSPLSVQESSSVPEYILSFHSCLVRVPLPLLLHPPFLQAEPPAAPPDTGPRCSGLTIFTLCTCRAAPMSCVHK